MPPERLPLQQGGRPVASRGPLSDLPENLFPGNTLGSAALEIIKAAVQLLPLRVRQGHSTGRLPEALSQLLEQPQSLLDA